jgi:peptide subunit release factor 1 (eRF1)
MPRTLYQLIKALEAARGNGTSMISLIMPPRDQACFLFDFSVSSITG